MTLHFASNYTQEQKDTIHTIMQEANKECYLLARAISTAKGRGIPCPNTIEALLSFMRYDALCWEEQANDSTDMAEIADCWEMSSLLRKYADQLRDLGVIPASIAWEPEEVKVEKEEENTLIVFPFVLRGAIAMTKKDYADAHGDARDALETLCQQMEMEAGKEEGVSHLCIDESTITAED